MTYLNRSYSLLRRPAYSNAQLSNAQLQLDSAMHSFSQHASDPIALASLTFGSFAYKTAQFSFLSGANILGVSKFIPRFLVNPSVKLAALGVEITSFRSANHFLGSLAGHPTLQDVFDKKGFLGTTVDFLALKTVGHLGAGQNFFLTHFAQANAMALGHEASAALELTEHQKGSYIERLIHAELTNLALGAGMGLMSAVTGARIYHLEKGMELRGAAHHSQTQSAIILPRSGLALFSSENGSHFSGMAKRLDELAKPGLHRIRTDKLPPPSSEPQTVAILTSGGDGPGENAVIESLVMGIHRLYGKHGWRTLGVFDGFRGLLEPHGRIFPLTPQEVRSSAAIRSLQKDLYGFLPSPRRYRGIGEIGGNLLRSSRTNPLANDPTASRVKETLRNQGIDTLIVLGGNGSLGASRDLSEQGVPLVFIPQSIDNDVPVTDVSVGFPSAVAEGVQGVLRFQNTAHSFKRWFIVEVMGQHSGALAVAIARKAKVQGLFVGENPRPLSDLTELIERYRTQGRSHGVILVSEGAEFLDHQRLLIPIPRQRGEDGRLLLESGQVAAWLSDSLGRGNSRPETLAYTLRGAFPTRSEIRLAEAFAQGALQLVASRQYGNLVGMHWLAPYWRRSFHPLTNLRGHSHLLTPAEIHQAWLELETDRH